MRLLAYMGAPSPAQVNFCGWSEVQSPSTLVMTKSWVPTATKQEMMMVVIWERKTARGAILQ